MNTQSKLMLTGASGNYGGRVLRFLLKKMPANNIAALARDPNSLAEFAKQGVDVRKGDYNDYDSLAKAFNGVDRLLLVSAEASSDRVKEETNAINAAKQAGVKHILYSSIQQKEGSPRKIPRVTEACEISERNIIKSGMKYTILRNSLYTESLLMNLGTDAQKTGEVRAIGGDGKTALATCSDMAEGAANIMIGGGHENKIYSLGSNEAFSFADVADALSKATGREITYVGLPPAEFIKERVAAGLPQPMAESMSKWFDAIAHGDFSEVTGDLEHLIKRKPTTYREVIAGKKDPAALLSY